MNNRQRPTIAGLLLGAAGFLASAPAAANLIELNSFWAGSGTATITYSGINYHDGSPTSLTESGGSGGFKAYDLTADPGRLHPFEAWCVDIFHRFAFPSSGTANTVDAETLFGSVKAIDLARLFANHHAAIDSTSSSATNQAAFQLAVWEIVYETSGTYNIGSGNFSATGTGSSLAQTWLSELATPSASAYTVKILQIVQGPSGTGPQDVAIFVLPEPGMLALLLTGLGLLARRRCQRGSRLGR